MKIKLDNLYNALSNPDSVILVWIVGLASVMFITGTLFFALYLIILSPMIGLGVLFTVCCLRVLYALTLGK